MEESIEIRRMKFETRFQWKYDDKTHQTIKRKGNRVLESKLMRKAQLDALKKNGVAFHKLEVKNIIQRDKSMDELRMVQWQKENASKAGFCALLKLIEDYSLEGNSQEAIRLLSLLLLGYTSKLFYKNVGERLLQCSRAPIVLARRHKSDLCGGFEQLAHFVECIAVNTNIDDALIHHNPAVLPDSYFASTLDESAYIRVSGLSKKHKFPAIYRNTAVLIHSSFFSGNDIRTFIRRNAWATVVVFGAKSLQKADSACLHIDLNKMELSRRDWDEMTCIFEKAHINELVGAFAAWITLLMYQENSLGVQISQWVNAGMEVLRKYHLAIAGTKQRIIQGCEKRYLWYQVATLRAFLDFCKEMELAETDLIESTWNQWCNELLPGSRSAEIYRQQEEKEQIAKERKQEDLFDNYERLLKEYIENATASMIALKRDISWEDYDPEEHYSKRASIILDKMTSADKSAGQFLVVKILRRDLAAFGKASGNEYDDTLTYVWSQKKRGGGLRPYIHSNNNITLRRGLSPHGVVLKLDMLDFLEPDTLKMLKEMAQQS